MTNRTGLLGRLPLLLALLAGCSDGPLDPGTRDGVASVAVAPTNLALEVGASASLTATPLDADGAALPGYTIVWTSTDTTVATVSPAGLVSARAAGAASIRASSRGKSGGVTVTVREPATGGEQREVAWIQIIPAGGTLPQAIGTSRQLGVVARALDGTEIAGRAATWASSVPSVASVSATGLLQAHAAGTTWVKAEVDGRRDSTLVSVPTLIARIEIDPAQLNLGVGDSRILVATARDANGGRLTRTFSWSSSNPAVATVDASGRVVATGAGSAIVTVTSEARSATTRVTVTGQQWRLIDVAGAPLPAILYSTTPEGAPGETRFQVTGGTLRIANGRYELRLDGWLLADGSAPVRAARASDGVVAYDVFTGFPMFFEGDEWQNRQPRFRGRFRDDGAMELDWSREAGAATVALGFVM